MIKPKLGIHSHKFELTKQKDCKCSIYKHIIHAQFPLCYKGGEAQASKKQCVANKKAKAKPTCTASKDPQSAAAKVCSSNLIINPITNKYIYFSSQNLNILF